MKLAFWKGRPSRGAASRAASRASSAAGSDTDLEPGEDDAAAAQADLDKLRTRARRRLIGAAALLLLVVVLVPMLLDPTPRAVPDNIPIDLPSDRTPFTPKIAPPPLATAAEAPTADAAPIPAAPGSAADAADVAGPAPVPKPDPVAKPDPAAKAAGKAGEAKAADGARADAHHAAHKAEGRAEGAGGRIYVQAAAFSRESAARELAAKLGKSGLTSFVERTESNGSTHYRVRLGPFATRDEAERTHERLHALGVSSNIVAPGAGT